MTYDSNATSRGASSSRTLKGVRGKSPHMDKICVRSETRDPSSSCRALKGARGKSLGAVSKIKNKSRTSSSRALKGARGKLSNRFTVPNRKTCTILGYLFKAVPLKILPALLLLNAGVVSASCCFKSGHPDKRQDDESGEGYLNKDGVMVNCEYGSPKHEGGLVRGFKRVNYTRRRTGPRMWSFRSKQFVRKVYHQLREGRRGNVWKNNCCGRGFAVFFGGIFSLLWKLIVYPLNWAIWWFIDLTPCLRCIEVAVSFKCRDVIVYNEKDKKTYSVSKMQYQSFQHKKDNPFYKNGEDAVSEHFRKFMTTLTCQKNKLVFWRQFWLSWMYIISYVLLMVFVAGELHGTWSDVDANGILKPGAMDSGTRIVLVSLITNASLFLLETTFTTMYDRRMKRPEKLGPDYDPNALTSYQFSCPWTSELYKKQTDDTADHKKGDYRFVTEKKNWFNKWVGEIGWEDGYLKEKERENVEKHKKAGQLQYDEDPITNEITNVHHVKWQPRNLKGDEEYTEATKSRRCTRAGTSRPKPEKLRLNGTKSFARPADTGSPSGTMDTVDKQAKLDALKRFGEAMKILDVIDKPEAMKPTQTWEDGDEKSSIENRLLRDPQDLHVPPGCAEANQGSDRSTDQGHTTESRSENSPSVVIERLEPGQDKVPVSSTSKRDAERREPLRGVVPFKGAYHVDIEEISQNSQTRTRHSDETTPTYGLPESSNSGYSDKAEVLAALTAKEQDKPTPISRPTDLRRRLGSKKKIDLRRRLPQAP